MDNDKAKKMKDTYVRRLNVTSRLEASQADMELRLGALKGDAVMTEILKESKEERARTLSGHIETLKLANELLREQFQKICELAKEVNKKQEDIDKF